MADLPLEYNSTRFPVQIPSELYVGRRLLNFSVSNVQNGSLNGKGRLAGGFSNRGIRRIMRKELRRRCHMPSGLKVVFWKVESPLQSCCNRSAQELAKPPAPGFELTSLDS